MNDLMLSRRTILTAAATAAVAQALPAFAAAESTANIAADTSIAKDWLLKWGNAWNSHDPHQMVLLHTEDAVTINRFGTLVPGREPLEKALGYLHGVNGAYRDTTLPPLQLIGVRRIAPKVMILQASWKSPVMNPDGKLDLSKQDDMLVTYTLLRDDTGWRATQVDLHNVEKMNVPYANPGQKD